MKRIVTLTLGVCLAATAAFAEVDGAWTASYDREKPGRIHLQMTRGRTHNMGMTMRVADFTGLSEAQIQAPTMTPVEFRLNREAGTARFEGTFRDGKGAGQFTFAPNRSYLSTLRGLGIDVDLPSRRGRERDEDDHLFSLAMHDVSTAFIRSMQAEGIRTSLDKYIALRIFNVTPEFIREMRSLGFEIGTDDLISARIHKVTPDYIRQMRAAGWNLTFDQLQSSRIHGATPEFAEEMRRLGYGNLKHSDLVSFRIHKVTPQFIRELRELGYDNLTASQLVSMRIHRVTPEFIRELKAAGYSGIPVSKLVSMRIHKIDAKFLERMSGD